MNRIVAPPSPTFWNRGRRRLLGRFSRQLHTFRRQAWPSPAPPLFPSSWRQAGLRWSDPQWEASGEAQTEATPKKAAHRLLATSRGVGSGMRVGRRSVPKVPERTSRPSDWGWASREAMARPVPYLYPRLTPAPPAPAGTGRLSAIPGAF